MKCERCYNEATSLRMSFFDTEMCCPACLEKERKHPKYAEAKEIERQHILNGDYNYAGIGRPSDL